MLGQQPPGSPPFPLGAIEPRENLTEGYLRVAAELGRRSRALLRSDTPFEPEGVHALRVSTKRLRSFWHLHRPGPVQELAKQSIDRLGETARLLAEARDNHVLHTLLGELGAGAFFDDLDEFAEAGGYLLAPTVRPQVREATRDEFAVTLQADADAWLRAGSVSDPAFPLDGFRRAFSKARKLGRKANREREPEAFHRWRRWVKYLRYQLEPIVTASRPRISEIYTELKRLGSLLGRRNDLQMLRSVLADGDFPAVEGAIALQDKLLEVRLPPLADTVFAQPADELVEVLRDELGD